ncbi:MAG: N5-carboxyaminoimidazole ribonucleotide synthase [Burkholderia sp.]|jgi:5-(carboxyamino)imidazole ribonucleotide synthase
MSEKEKALLPGTSLGLMGGGQLGKMFAQAAARMGYHVTVLEPHSPCPAGEVARSQIATGYEDRAGLHKLAESVSAVTTEFENVPAPSLALLEKAGLRVAPPSAAVAVSQDRNAEKHFVSAVAGVPVAPHQAVLTEADLDRIDAKLLPGILKTARLGYDGKGQALVDTPDDVRTAFENFSRVECVLEKRLALKTEVSVIVARNEHGETATYPVCENHHRHGILAVTVMPARIPGATAAKARGYAETIAKALHYVGVLCIEFFVLEDGSLLVNELAPRPHNSGHATIDACVTSQYEQQVRTMTGLPLGSTEQHSFAVMLNILGDEWFDENGSQREPDWAALAAVPGAKIHLYGKDAVRRARKMGHVTLLGRTPEEAMERARAAARILHLPEPD